MTTTSLDLHVLEELDFDLPCEQGVLDSNNPCDLPARWVAKRYCCGHITLYCDKHRVLLLAFLRARSVIYCTMCNSDRPADDMIEFTPLKYRA